MARTTLRTLGFDDAVTRVEEGAAFADLRPTPSFLEVHIPGSLALLYEAGPGFAGRARDCLPLDLPLVLLATGEVDLADAAAALRGKGFAVAGAVEDGLNEWAARRGAPASTEIADGREPPDGVLLDVGDPGGPSREGAARIPVDELWARVDDVPEGSPVVVASGAGVRAALAIGMLERAGRDVVLWRPRPR